VVLACLAVVRGVGVVVGATWCVHVVEVGEVVVIPWGVVACVHVC